MTSQEIETRYLPYSAGMLAELQDPVQEVGLQEAQGEGRQHGETGPTRQLASHELRRLVEDGEEGEPLPPHRSSAKRLARRGRNQVTAQSRARAASAIPAQPQTACSCRVGVSRAARQEAQYCRPSQGVEQAGQIRFRQATQIAIAGRPGWLAQERGRTSSDKILQMWKAL